ncbi:MAG: hypothetical protein L3J29_01215 [Cyclobacteriaceae bacterium]|nr:hypothetical protein [Cyclobacteriaceae bacterium]
MKFLLFLVITLSLLVSSQPSKAQVADTLYLKSTFWGNKFYKGDTIYGINGVLEELAANEQPYNLMLKAKKDNTFAQIFGAAGGLLIGWSVATDISGGEHNWYLIGIGAGFVAISIPISINFKKKANQALRDHNALMANSARWHYKPTYHFGLSGNGLQLRVKF